MTRQQAWQRWAPDAAGGVGASGLALVEANRYTSVEDPTGPVLVALALGVAVGLSRALPGTALAVAWGMGFVHVVTDTNPLLTEALLAVVAFGCARWGSVATVWLSAVSIPVSAVAVVLQISPYLFYEALQVAGMEGLAVSAARSAGDDWRVVATLLGASVLALPWLAGLALRFSARSAASRRSQVTAEAQRDQAEEVARLREDQARLARDVHDVVGHSLAVILAQAESAQYLDDADSTGLKRTMANIATTARSSLDDVRQVLASTSGNAAPSARLADLDSLVEGVRAAGHEVRTTEVGTPQPLPPDLEVVAFRVLQEMLTNAVRHGRRDRPVLVERHWEGDLRIEVQNTIDVGGDETRPLQVPTEAPVVGGQGLEGMRRRVEGVGGRLDVRRRTDPPTFTATAWVPVRSQ